MGKTDRQRERERERQTDRQTDKDLWMHKKELDNFSG